jgi:two-component sensor histidine kinase
VQIDGPTLMLEPKTAQTIAVALHELATNAVKYGALSDGEGRVEVAWSRAIDGQLSLRWTERRPSNRRRARASAPTLLDALFESNQRAKCASIGTQPALSAKSFFRPPALALPLEP